MNDENGSNLNNNQVLSKEQIRVLACLMEKHLATPNNYPLTPNALTLACNQKSNRFPVMSLEEGKVVSTAQQLNELGYVGIEYGERINKYSHRAPGKLGITREQQAVLAMLMLREPLTLNDIKARTDKMVGFDNIEQVKDTVEELMSEGHTWVIKLPIASGQREERFTHLLAGEPDLTQMPVKEVKASPEASQSQSTKIAELERRIERLEAELNLRNDHY